MSASSSTSPDAGKAVRTYLNTGNAEALDQLTRAEVVDYVTKGTRPLQDTHGKDADGTAAAHRNQRERVCDRLRQSTGDMTNRDVVDVMALVDRDLRIGPKSWNDKHSAIENAEKKTRATGAAPMSSKVTQSDVAERGMVRVDQIRAGLSSGDINATSARWMLEDAAQPMMSGGVSPLALWKKNVDLRKYPSEFRGLVEKTLAANGGDVAINVKDAELRNDKTISKTSAVVRRKQLVYKDDGTVDPKCQAFKQGLVDKSGRPTEPQKAAAAGLVHVEGHWRGDTWVPPHQRHAPGSKAAAAPKAKAAAAPKSKAAAPKAKATPPAARAAPAAKTSSPVAVKGYTRADGTKVAGHVRSTPGAASSSGGGCKSSSSSSTSSNNRRGGGGGGGSSGGSVQVSGYTRSNGTYVSGYTRSK